MLFDTHAHYDDARFDSDRDLLLSSMPENHVGLILNPGCDIASSKQAISYAEKFPFVYAAVGIHPENIEGVDLEQDMPILEALAVSSPRVRAIGEIGLDYFYDDASPREVQRRVFEEQLALAKDLALPVVIHNRDAHQDTLELLKKYRPKGIMHCFSGSAELAQEVVRLGMYVGFTGVITFKNARKAVEAAAAVPLERLLVETDCPYMAPEPYRGKRCDSTMLHRMVEKLGELKGISPQEMADITWENACRVYGISQ